MSPFLTGIGCMEFFLWRAGELTSIRAIAREHGRGDPPSSYSPMLMPDQIERLHYERIVVQRPNVLVVGSSRVARFRSEMFEPDIRFYNSSRSVRSVQDVADFISVWPADYVPQSLLLGLDETWFNPHNPVIRHFSADVIRDDYLKPPAHAFAFRNLARAVVRGNIDFDMVKRIILGRDEGLRRFGVGAWTTRGFDNEVWRLGGYRNDGSVQEMDKVFHSVSNDVFMPERLNRIRKGLYPYVPAQAPDRARLTLLAETLTRLQARGTRIVGFIPPVTSGVRREIAAIPALNHFYEDTARALLTMFRDHRWPFYDARRLEDFGLDDRSMIDGVHSTETFHVALLLRMAQDTDVREALHLQPAKLQAALNNPHTTPQYPVYAPAKHRSDGSTIR